MARGQKQGEERLLHGRGVGLAEVGGGSIRVCASELGAEEGEDGDGGALVGEGEVGC